MQAQYLKGFIVRTSAIVSAYYAEQYIEGRIANLMEQSELPEIVVVAKKGSVEAKKAAGCKVIETDDIPTIYKAWNMAIEASTGDYITNANCDDRLYPNALKLMADTLYTQPDYAAVYTNVDRVKEIGGPPHAVYEWGEGGLEYMLTKGCFMGPMPMWRKSLHDKYGLFDPEMRSAGDYEFWMRCLSNGEKFYHIRGATWGAYLERNDSAEHREKLRSIWEQARAKAKYRQEVTCLSLIHI